MTEEKFQEMLSATGIRISDPQPVQPIPSHVVNWEKELSELLDHQEESADDESVESQSVVPDDSSQEDRIPPVEMEGSVPENRGENNWWRFFLAGVAVLGLLVLVSARKFKK